MRPPDIRQLASPFEVYENPANAFVAGFIGENNRLEGIVAGRDGETVVVDLGGGLTVRARTADTLSVGGRVVLSVRPERVSIDRAGRENCLRLHLENIVYVGDASRLILSGPLTPEFVIKTDRPPAEIGLVRGQELDVAWTARDCLAFAEHG